jgi:hypothetical protein
MVVDTIVIQYGDLVVLIQNQRPGLGQTQFLAALREGRGRQPFDKPQVVVPAQFTKRLILFQSRIILRTVAMDA